MRGAKKLALAVVTVAVLGPASWGLAQQIATLDVDAGEKPPPVTG